MQKWNCSPLQPQTILKFHMHINLTSERNRWNRYTGLKVCKIWQRISSLTSFGIPFSPFDLHITQSIQFNLTTTTKPTGIFGSYCCSRQQCNSVGTLQWKQRLSVKQRKMRSITKYKKSKSVGTNQQHVTCYRMQIQVF